MASSSEGPSGIQPAGSIQFQNSNLYPPLVQPCQRNYFGDFLSGMRPHGRMSVVRRFFCLFATFDLLFTCLVWLICLVLAGNFDFTDAFESQIVHYHIETSLFDIVMASGVRFTALILFYALLHINHWIIVAMTTAGTCVFLVAKVYLFNWVASNQPVLQVLLILSSFIIAWAEAWLLDLRVIPQENTARDYINAAIATDETSPLLRKFIENSRLDAMSESVASKFYSPVATPEGSDDEDLFEPLRIKHRELAAEMKYQLTMKGEDILLSAWNLINSDCWKKEMCTLQRDTIYSQKSSDGRRKIFMLVGTIPTSAKDLFEVLFKNIENLSTWNPTITTSKIIQVVDEYSDITYQVSSGSSGIKSRDFVLLRRWKWIDEHMVIGSASVSCSAAPLSSSHVRGENGPSCWCLREMRPNECEVRWLVNTDVKVSWVPRGVVDASFLRVLDDYMKHLRVHLSVEPSY